MAFDPYHKWLGIPKNEQPPHHYRLLGLAVFESDEEVIDSAANRLMAYVKQCATGEHAVASQKILGQLSAARLCLLNKKKKAIYDAKLKATLAADEEDEDADVEIVESRPAALDPYHEWLGIPKDRRPPTHYQLLGISPEEASRKVIEGAFRRQTKHVKEFLGGPDDRHAQQILGELEDAKSVLLDRNLRREYDSKLHLLHRAQREGSSAPRRPKKARTNAWLSIPLAPLTFLAWLFEPAEKEYGPKQESIFRQPMALVSILAIGIALMAASLWLPWKKYFSLIAAEPEVAAGTIEPSVYSLSIQPANANVIVDGMDATVVRDGDRHVINVPKPDGTQSFLLRVSADGFQDNQQTLTPSPGSQEALEIVLEPTKDQPSKVASSTPDWQEVLSKINPDADSLLGKASKEGSDLVAGPNELTIIRLPVQSTDSYEVRFSFTRTFGTNFVGVNLPIRDTACAIGIGFSGDRCGIAQLDRQTSTIATFPIENNRRYTAHAKVSAKGTTASIGLTIDDQAVIAWEGDLNRLSPEDRVAAVSDTVNVGVGIGSSAKFHQVQFRSNDSIPEFFENAHKAGVSDNSMTPGSNKSNGEEFFRED